MNDLSGLTYSILRLRMREDLFPGKRNEPVEHGQGNEMLEKCDGCGSVVPLYHIIFTGAKFLCLKCGKR